MFNSLSILTPLFTPATADPTATRLTSMMMILWNKKLDSPTMPKCTRPAFSCTTPKPNEVTIPKKVLTNAKISTTSPMGPLIFSFSNGYRPLRIAKGNL